MLYHKTKIRLSYSMPIHLPFNKKKVFKNLVLIESKNHGQTFNRLMFRIAVLDFSLTQKKGNG